MLLLFQAEGFGNSFVMELYVNNKTLEKITQAVSSVNNKFTKDKRTKNKKTSTVDQLFINLYITVNWVLF